MRTQCLQLWSAEQLQALLFTTSSTSPTNLSTSLFVTCTQNTFCTISMKIKDACFWKESREHQHFFFRIIAPIESIFFFFLTTNTLQYTPTKPPFALITFPSLFPPHTYTQIHVLILRVVLLGQALWDYGVFRQMQMYHNVVVKETWKMTSTTEYVSICKMATSGFPFPYIKVNQMPVLFFFGPNGSRSGFISKSSVVDLLVEFFGPYSA